MNNVNIAFLAGLALHDEIAPVIRRQDRPQFTEEEHAHLQTLGPKAKKKAVQRLKRKYAQLAHGLDSRTNPVLGRDILNQK